MGNAAQSTGLANKSYDEDKKSKIEPLGGTGIPHLREERIRREGRIRSFLK